MPLTSGADSDAGYDGLLGGEDLGPIELVQASLRRPVHAESPRVHAGCQQDDLPRPGAPAATQEEVVEKSGADNYVQPRPAPQPRQLHAVQPGKTLATGKGCGERIVKQTIGPPAFERARCGHPTRGLG